MWLAPHGSSGGVFCSWAATSVPGALASLVLTFSQLEVSKPGRERFSPGSVATAELTTCQFGTRSRVSAFAAGASAAQHAAAAIASLPLLTERTEIPPRPRVYS